MSSYPYLLSPTLELKSYYWDFRSKRESSPFALNRDEDPVSLTLQMFTLCQVKILLIFLPKLCPKIWLSVCLPVLQYDNRHQSLPLTPEYISAWQLPLSAWPVSQKDKVGCSCTHDNPHLPQSLRWPLYIPIAEGLGSSLAPVEVVLGALSSPERLCASCLHFYFRLSTTVWSPWWY